MYRVVAVLVLATLIAACSSSTTITPSSYVGLWGGQSHFSPPNVICGDGYCPAVSFTVNANLTVTCFVGGGVTQGDCTPDLPGSAGTGVSIQGNQFQITSGAPLYGVTGVFDSVTSAHGTLTVPIGPDGQGSNGTYYQWTASIR
jgi:hypothetical protein